jgi:serine/threonine protein kinase
MQMETLPAGTVLHGRYQVERALGSGGFGHVYLSVDLQTRTQYAIKEYLVTGASGKAQLEHEAQVLSQLHHPNLPALLTAFDERGHYYVVLGYIEGNDLTDYIRVVRQKNEVIPLARLMEWLLSICDAVAFLHSQRPPIIHRDIKPDNIRITPGGTATLVDLGNAKTAADGARTLFFIRHQGTPGYAPLEQYPGGSGTDERSDIYALGGTLYFALTAHEPPSVSARNQALQQKHPDLPSLQERLAQNPPDVPQEARQFRLGVSKPAKPAPRHSRHLAQLGTLSPEVLYRLDAIIQRAMAMKPRDRYPSVADFSQDLRQVLKALPASTIPVQVNGRQVDPHSTQPDLPMLYEAIQSNQAASQAAPPAPSAASNPASTRCPRCGADLSRFAPYCSRCGSPLPQTSKATKQQMESAQPHPGKAPASAQNIADEATLLISSRNPAQDPAELARRSGSSAQAGPFPAQQPASARQQMAQAPAQTPASTAGRITSTGANAGVKPFLSSASLNPSSSQAQQAPQASNPPSPASDTGFPRRLFVSLTIAIVALILVMLILLVFLQGHHHLLFQTPLSSPPLQVQHMSAQAGRP